MTRMTVTGGPVWARTVTKHDAFRKPLSGVTTDYFCDRRELGHEAAGDSTMRPEDS